MLKCLASLVLILFSTNSTWAGPVYGNIPANPLLTIPNVAPAVSLEQTCAAQSPSIAQLVELNNTLKNGVFGTLAGLAQKANKEINQQSLQQLAQIFDSQKTARYGRPKLGEYLIAARKQSEVSTKEKSCGVLKTSLEGTVARGKVLICQMTTLLQAPVPAGCVQVEKAYYREI